MRNSELKQSVQSGISIKNTFLNRHLYSFLLLLLAVLLGMYTLANPTGAANDIYILGKVNYEPVFKVYPERRIPEINNWQNQNIVEIRYPGTSTPIFTQVAETGPDGSAVLQPIDVSMLPPGEYDVSVKGISHLRQVYRNRSIRSHQLDLDLTSEGTELVAGDTVTDNYINAHDLSYLIRNLYSSSDIRADLNRDDVINSLDVSNIAVNLYKRGEN